MAHHESGHRAEGREQLLALEPAPPEQQAATNADVVSTAVMTATPATAKVLLFVDQATTSSRFTGPKLSGSRIVVTMDKVGGKWLISAIRPV